MQIGSVQILLNHPMVIVGSTGFLEDIVTIPLKESSGEASQYEHLAVPARVQVAPVQVRVWQGPHPAVGVVTFDGSVALPDGALAIFDIDGLSRCIRKIGAPGSHRLTIRVDDSDQASRVEVVINRGDKDVSVSTVSGYRLPLISGVVDTLTPAAVLNLILTGHDLPTARLVNALDLIIRESVYDASPRASALRASRIRQVVEWLRWLNPYISLARYRDLGSSLEEQISGIGKLDFSTISVSSALALMQSIEQCA